MSWDRLIDLWSRGSGKTRAFIFFIICMVGMAIGAFKFQSVVQWQKETDRRLDRDDEIIKNIPKMGRQLTALCKKNHIPPEENDYQSISGD